jgi:hypothetical protein
MRYFGRMEKHPLDDLSMQLEFSEQEFRDLLLSKLILQEAMWRVVLDHVALIIADRSGGTLTKELALESLLENVRQYQHQLAANLIQKHG